ncbi:peptidoglycan-binding domain-containing protein [Serinicoccus sediminis]|uniref:peptidoglycan-binding domain-containing protein n=1 Tax=Serinicoccus sediminis TaxID=2306021 RepID=UPI001EE0136B|nr:peptidoglycan-binding domain-containing protein [Serinicoccus sediminis]
MAIHQGPYVGARNCTDGPTAGARALMSWYLGAYADEGGTNLGIYNCRTVRGGSTTSLHGEGRACDLGNPVGAAWQEQLADLLVDNSAELEIQCVIFNRRIWSNAHPNRGWRPYGGRSPHTDHIHAELTWEGARTLTAERIRDVLGDPSPTRGGGGGGGGAGSFPTTGRLLRLTSPLMRGDDVRQVQQRLVDLGYALPRFGADGMYGEETAQAVHQLQATAGLAADGVVGPRTRAALATGVRGHS